ncbi:uncharacterized protein BXZ73DRAFT_43646, partial [Epithele typhae]|uniref:uncharacterized protein n=1 Tax=Epithele typhae TaxID=378194 RepID=UPI0020071EE1
AWMDCATAMKDHDEAMVQGWKEEIDTHLVFAGLFSAILTAFNVEAYQMLLPDDDTSSSTSSTNELLRLIAINMAQTNGLISEVLSSGNTGSGGNNNWAGSFAVVINALWFCSLICSLAAASISILIKQWLNQYTSGIASVSPEIARIRQFRYDSLKKWRVAELMMLLPVLLQSAVVLFLLGLILFLSQLNKQITIAASTLIVLLLAFLFVTAILPTFISDCPYQSPQAWGVFVVVQAFKRPVRSIARSLEMYASRQLKRIMVESKGSLLDQHLLIGADITFLDDTFLRDVIRPCLCAMPAKAAADCYANIMSHRADHVAASGVVYFDNHARLESAVVLTDITLDILQKLHEESDTAVDQHLTLSVLQTLEPLLIRALPMTYPHVCRVLIGLLDDDDKTVRQLAFQILYQHLSRNAQLAAQYASTGCHGASISLRVRSSAPLF